MTALSAQQGEVLVGLARDTIARKLGVEVPRPDAHDEWLSEKRAVFVTLTERGELRGCVGQLEPRFTLEEAVRHAADAAAFRDHRFSPVSREELDLLEVEISVLSPLEAVPVSDEEDALHKLRPGVDGVVLTHGQHSGVFIPEMWKKLPDPRDFLYHLKLKAGLPAAGWLEGTHVERFTADVVHG